MRGCVRLSECFISVTEERTSSEFGIHLHQTFVAECCLFVQAPHRSLDSLVQWLHKGWTTRVRFPAGVGIFLFIATSRPSLGPTQPLILRAPHRPDDGGSKDLWNVGKLLPDYTALQPRRQPSKKITALLNRLHKLFKLAGYPIWLTTVFSWEADDTAGMCPLDPVSV
jgi:hypothetical protein